MHNEMVHKSFIIDIGSIIEVETFYVFPFNPIVDLRQVIIQNKYVEHLLYRIIK